MQRTVSAAQVASLVAGFGLSPAYSGLAESLRVVITDGRIPAGVRLPSERQLTGVLGVSRTTIARAYSELRDHGFLVSRQGSGWITTLPEARGRRGDHLLPLGDQPMGKTDLTMAAPAGGAGIMAAFGWAVEQMPGYLAGAGYHPAGLPELREAVAASFSGRGLPTSPEQIMITPGALAAVAIAARALIRPGARALLESPVYPNAIATFVRAGARVCGVDAGETWADAIRAAARQLSPAAAYLIPDFHNPTGALRSDSDRARAADALRRSRTTAVVDESTVLLNLDGGPMPAPFGVYHADTLSVGSLSKPVWGGLRIGWVRVPEERMEEFARARLSLDLGSPVLEQLAATRLISDAGLLEQRLDQLRASRDAAADALARELPDWSVPKPSGGLHLWCELPEALSSVLVAKAEDRGVMLAAGPEFA
ncbi:MAG: PLP-dependent aminotransferase family protein, partial [Actinomycetia bacterium]|nr:PLP-dependent aminotransferase family protein [Actinomycetes bacterium]